MQTIRLLFSTTGNPFSYLIRTATWSRWSHVSLVDGADVIEAVAIHGVRRISLDERIHAAKDFAFSELPCVDRQIVLAAAESQIGKPYDYTAVVGMGLHRDWHEMDAWFCSELVAWAFEEGKSGLFRGESLNRITPEHLWMLKPINSLKEEARRGLSSAF